MSGTLGKKAGLSFVEAAVQVLREENRPLGSLEIASLALERGLVLTTGKTPQNTFSSIITQSVKKDPRSPFVCLAKNSFFLKEFSRDAVSPDNDYVGLSSEPARPKTRTSMRSNASNQRASPLSSQRSSKRSPMLRSRSGRPSPQSPSHEDREHAVLHPPSSPSSWDAPSLHSVSHLSSNSSDSRRSSLTLSEGEIDCDLNLAPAPKRMRVGEAEDVRAHSPVELTADALRAHHLAASADLFECSQEVVEDAAALLMSILSNSTESDSHSPVYIGRYQHSLPVSEPRYLHHKKALLVMHAQGL